MQTSRSNTSDSLSLGSLFESFERKPILVVGDLMLDTYWEGDVGRISPEAPVPVLNLHSTSYRLGGAANVALNLSSLGCQAAMIGVVGDDEKGRLLTQRANERNINVNYIIVDSQRKTTEKIRIIGRHQHLLRVDNEDDSESLPSWENRIVQSVEEYIKLYPDVSVILQDYDKGLFSAKVIHCLMNLCKRYKVMVSVDPKRRQFFDYKYATIFKPNLKEMFDALGTDISQRSMDEHLETCANQLRAKIAAEHLVVTLSEKGIFWLSDEGSKHLATQARQVADVSGAGDTTISVLTLVYSLTKDMLYSIRIANIAAGIVCGKVGTASVNREELYEECQRMQLQ